MNIEFSPDDHTTKSSTDPDLDIAGRSGAIERISVNAAEWDAVDPLGGILHSDWEERQKAAEAAAARPAIQRAFSRFVTWLKADPPNMSDGDIRLDVDPNEPLIPLEQQFSERTMKYFMESIDPSQDMTPDTSGFYDDLLRPVHTTNRPDTPRK